MRCVLDPSLEEQENPEEPKAMGPSNEEFLALQRELAECKDKYLRALADMENMRKRMIKERTESVQQATCDVILEFLKPLDNFENALNFTEKMSEEVQNWAKGFQMILNQFKEVLSLHGVSPSSSKGVLFDPHEHEAIEMLETDSHPQGTVVEEYSRGYKMGNRTLRVARVRVATAPKNKEEQEGE